MEKRLFKQGEMDNDFRDYRPIPFWSWNNELDPERLARQIGEMKRAGLGGFIMHARTGLRTEYLSEEWFECVRVCLDEAKRLDMTAWMYDENGWPSGFAGGKLLEKPENLAQYLSYGEKSQFDPEAFCVYADRGGEMVRISAGGSDERYHCVYLHSSPANTDILNPDVVSQFIECTYQPYFERFGDRFGREFTGFFTDEPQYFRYATPYTRAAPAAFEKKYPGENLLDGLVWLFLQDERGYAFREKYYKLMNELYTVNYYKRLYDWCEDHGVKFTGHSVEEGACWLQMWGGAGVMPSYEYESVPGIDFLGRNQSTPLAGKQVGSVASQLGKPQVLTETFGCSGFDANPRELKFLAETQFVSGVNLMCLHLMNYSMKGQGKLDHPPTFSKHMPWWKDFKVFNDYFGRLGCLIAQTQECAETVVIHPMHSVYLSYERLDEDASKVYDIEFNRLMAQLDAHHVSYHLADETLLAKYGSVSDGKLRIGKCTYRNVVLPYCDTLDGSTKALLEAYAGAGGRIFVESKLPSYIDGLPGTLRVTSNIGWADLEENPEGILIEGAPQYSVRRGEGFRMVYFVNTSDAPVTLHLRGSFERFDPVSGGTGPVCGKLLLRERDSAVLVRFEDGTSPCAAARAEEAAVEDMAGRFEMVSSDPNNLTLDFVRAAKGDGEFGPKKYVYQLQEHLIREDYRGKLRTKYTFCVDDPCQLVLRCENSERISATLNGRDLKFTESPFDFNFLEADITDLVRLGENEVVFALDYWQAPLVRYALFDPEATESLRNCLIYNTEIESVYIRGDFVLTEDLHIAARDRKVGLTDIQRQGYPMFSGEMAFEGEIDFMTGLAEFEAEGRFMTVGVEVDGEPAGSMVLENKLLVRAPEGRHSVTLRMTSSLRNTFGPFHLEEEEPMGVSPSSFTLMGMWGEGDCASFHPGYHVVKFGLDSLKVRFLRDA